MKMRPNNDSLFRVSLKAVIKNDKGQVLVVKETGDSWWNLPGGGMDYGETFDAAMKRELHEEVGYSGDLTMKLIAAEEAAPLDTREVEMWQMRLIYEVHPANMNFSVGEEAEEIAFLDPQELKNSPNAAVQLLYTYCI